jgi:hypothetical protein
MNDLADLFCKQWRDRISDLMELLGSVTHKKIVVREGLKSRRFPYGETSTLQRIWMDEVVTILRYVACHGCRWTAYKLNAETVGKLPTLPVFMVRP